MDDLKDLKDAIIYTVNASTKTNATSLFVELLDLLYAEGFSDGQNYVYDEHHYAKIVRCKDCKYHKKVSMKEWGVWCPKLERVCSDDWFCAEGK